MLYYMDRRNFYTSIVTSCAATISELSAFLTQSCEIWHQLTSSCYAKIEAVAPCNEYLTILIASLAILTILLTTKAYKLKSETKVVEVF